MAVCSGVLVVAYGGPSNKEEVTPFLAGMARHGRLNPARIPELEEQYRNARGLSFVGAVTAAQAEACRTELASRSLNMPSYVGMRHWNPYIADTLRGMADDGICQMAVIIMAPHGEESSRAHYRRAIDDAIAEVGVRAPTPVYTANWHNHPLYIEALAGRVQETIAAKPALAGLDIPWIFTAHSVPQRGGGAEYTADFMATGNALSAHLGHPWIPAYQSAPPTGATSRPAIGGADAPPGTGSAWLGPDISDVLRECAKKGHKSALVVPIGFLADHKEVAYDLRVAANAAAREAGLEPAVASTVGTHPVFIKMMADLVQQALAE